MILSSFLNPNFFVLYQNAIEFGCDKKIGLRSGFYFTLKPRMKSARKRVLFGLISFFIIHMKSVAPIAFFKVRASRSFCLRGEGRWVQAFPAKDNAFFVLITAIPSSPGSVLGIKIDIAAIFIRLGKSDLNIEFKWKRCTLYSHFSSDYMKREIFAIFHYYRLHIDHENQLSPDRLIEMTV